MALGKIKADTLEHSTAGSVDTQYVVGGVFTGWINYDAVATTTRGSLNSSSLTDNSTGDFTMAFTASSASATDRLVQSLAYNGVNNGLGSDPTRAGVVTSQSHNNNSTSTVRMLYYYGSDGSNNGAAYDLDNNYFGKVSELA